MPLHELALPAIDGDAAPHATYPRHAAPGKEHADDRQDTPTIDLREVPRPRRARPESACAESGLPEAGGAVDEVTVIRDATDDEPVAGRVPAAGPSIVVVPDAEIAGSDTSGPPDEAEALVEPAPRPASTDSGEAAVDPRAAADVDVDVDMDMDMDAASPVEANGDTPEIVWVEVPSGDERNDVRRSDDTTPVRSVFDVPPGPEHRPTARTTPVASVFDVAPDSRDVAPEARDDTDRSPRRIRAASTEPNPLLRVRLALATRPGIRAAGSWIALATMAAFVTLVSGGGLQRVAQALLIGAVVTIGVAWAQRMRDDRRRQEDFRHRLAHGPLERADLTGVALDGATLWGQNLRHATLTGCSAHHALLDGADLTGASLTAASLRAASLRGADLARVRAGRVDLTAADLTGATATDAWLADAVLRGARLEAADLTGADLSGADLSGATHDESTIWTDVTTDHRTVLPDGAREVAIR